MAQEILNRLTPAILNLAMAALKAILAGDWEKAARKAEEAGRRQAARLAADAVLKARSAGKKAK